VTVAAAFRSPAPLETKQTARTNAANDKAERPSPRPEVMSAMRALREMPPFAREREINHGRYSHFSPEERELLKNLQR